MRVYFSSPYFLYGLFVIPLFIFFHFVTLRMHKRRALKFANFDAISRVKGIDLYSQNFIPLIINALIVFSIILSISGITLEYDAQVSSFSFVIAIDTSRSMEANDLSPNRLEAAKQSSIDFVDSLPYSSEIGVLSFSGNSLIHQKITQDHTLVKNALRQIDFSAVGGTDIGEAIITGTNMLGDKNTKAILLFSDGQINVGTVESAINYAEENGIIVHTFALGTQSGGATSYGTSQVDEDALRSLAYNTGGVFSNILTDEDFSERMQEIGEIQIGKVSRPLSVYLLLFSIFLIIFQYLLINARLGLFP